MDTREEGLMDTEVKRDQRAMLSCAPMFLMRNASAMARYGADDHGDREDPGQGEGPRSKPKMIESNPRISIVHSSLISWRRRRAQTTSRRPVMTAQAAMAYVINPAAGRRLVQINTPTMTLRTPIMSADQRTWSSRRLLGP
jgi:hypothetical protein